VPPFLVFYPAWTTFSPRFAACALPKHGFARRLPSSSKSPLFLTGCLAMQLDPFLFFRFPCPEHPFSNGNPLVFVLTLEQAFNSLVMASPSQALCLKENFFKLPLSFPSTNVGLKTLPSPSPFFSLWRRARFGNLFLSVNLLRSI